MRSIASSVLVHVHGLIGTYFVVPGCTKCSGVLQHIGITPIIFFRLYGLQMMRGGLWQWKIWYKEAKRFNAIFIGEHVRADWEKTDGSAAGVAVGAVAQVLTTQGLADEIKAFLQKVRLERDKTALEVLFCFLFFF
mgnify:CR=1 FL=1